MKTVNRFAALAVMAFCSAIHAEDWREQLQAATDAKDPHAQIELIRRMLAEKPDSALQTRLAKLWLEVADYDMAEQSLSTWPDAPATLRAQVLAEVIYRRDRKAAEAMALLESQLATEPADLATVRQLAGYLQTAGDNQKLVALLTRTPGVDREAALLVLRANAKRSLGDLDGALKDFAQAEQADPEDAAVRGQRPAFERLRTGVAKIQQAATAIQGHPGDPGPVISRAHWYLYADVPAPALQDAESALGMVPGSVGATLLAAKARGAMGELSAREARDTLELDLSKAATLDALGRVFKADIALSKNPRDAAALAERSSALNAIEQYQRALTDANAALAVDPKKGRAYFEKICALTRLDRRDEAAAALREFTAIKPTNEQLAATLSILTEARFSASQFELALADITRALGLKPTAYYYKQRAAILTRLDRSEEAQLDLAKAQQLEKGSRR